MRLFHLSDLHIGLKLVNHDLREDQEAILSQIVEMAAEEKPDTVLIAGDLYDRAVPSADAAEVFDHFISALAAAVPEAEIMMISGNHDSAARINVYRSILSHQRVHMIGMPPQTPDERIEQVVLTDSFGRVHFYLMPFVRPSMVRGVIGTDEDGSQFSYDETVRRLLAREEIDRSERNVLVSHQFYLPRGTDPEQIERMDSEIRTVGNIDAVYADVLETFDYAALGHIHKPMKVGADRFRYCGTPLACSVSEAGQQKGIIEADLGEKGNLSIRVLPLRPLHQVRVLEGCLEEVLARPSEDYVTVTLTDPADLNVIDMQDRLRTAFPNLLEIRRKTLRGSLSAEAPAEAAELDPMALCDAFLGGMDGPDRALLTDVMNTVRT